MTIVERLAAALADRYRIERELGAGGMATVYLAHDVKHDRKVALKVLKPELAAVLGAERFLAEIKTTANLQHSHILALFDSGQVEGTVFYVMPFVDGETLRDRLSREKQLPIDDALRLAREVADALQYAHHLGVIHRDIKPENILLQGGHAVVADFGIALAAANTGGSRMTETGMSLGTPTYMSPEQAMGERNLDARTDIYALGCVLYEMLTGDAPFTGSTAQAIVAKVLTEKPALLTSRRERVPPHVEDAVLTALEKLPADRFPSAAEFIAALGNGSGTTAGFATRGQAGARRGRQPARSARAIGVGAMIVAVLTGALGWAAGRAGRAIESPPARLALVEPSGHVQFNAIARTIDISADGQTVVFAAVVPGGGSRTLLRRLDHGEATPIPNADGAMHLKLSPDGRFLYASFNLSTMQRMPLAGGAWTNLPNVMASSFLSIGPDGTLWLGNPLGLGTNRISPDGRDSLFSTSVNVAQVLPGGRYGVGISFGTASNSGFAQRVDLRTGELVALSDVPIVEIGYTQGYLLMVRADLAMVAAPFDIKSGRITGEVVELASDVTVSGAGFAQWAVAENGTVVYVPGQASDLVRVSRDGAARLLLRDRERYHSPRVSPDGRSVLVDVVRTDGRDVWIAGLGGEEMRRVTFNRDGHDPVWAADSRSFYYLAGDAAGRIDIFRTQLGSASPAQALKVPVDVGYTGTPLLGGGFLTTVAGPRGRGSDVVRFGHRAQGVDTLLASAADESFPVPSPDGRWYAYTSDHSGRTEVYLRSLGGSDIQLQVSADGATEPVWSRDGREIFYRRPTASGAELMAAALELGPVPRIVTRTRLFDVTEYDSGTPHAGFDVTPDGRSFVFVRRNGGDHIVVLQNVAELARRVARGTGALP